MGYLKVSQMTFSDSVPYFYLEAAKGWQQRDRCERDIRV